MRFLSKPLIIADGQGDGVMVIPSARNAHHHRAVPALFSLTETTDHPLDPLIEETLDLVSMSFLGAGLMDTDDMARYTGELYPGDINARLMVDGIQPVLYLPDFNLNPGAIARSTHFAAAFMFQLIKGLRAINQIEYRALNVALAPEDMIRWGRLIEADRTAYAILIAYDMRDLHPGLWRYVLGSEYSDIAVRVAQLDERGDADMDDWSGLNTALLYWFRDKARINACDRAMLDFIDNRRAMRSDQGMDHPLTAEMIRALCVMEDGITYIPDKMLGIFAVKPKTIISDSINAAHLAQIMRETDATILCNVPFRDATLAHKIFPQS